MEGFKDWLLAEGNMQIPKDAIKIALPKIRQQTNYSCGPAALRAIAKYFQVGSNDEEYYIKLCRATQKNGSSPQNIAAAGRKLGLNAKIKEGMSLKELFANLKRGIPVICSIQAWGSGQEVYDKAESGHYVVAIGYDDKKVYFEDPSIEHPDRGYMPYDDFNDRWHDIEMNGRHFSHLGIALWKKNPLPDKKRSRAKKIQ